MRLTSLNRVKAGLGIDKNDRDALLGRLIASASSRIENYLRRSIELTSRQEFFSPSLSQREFALSAYPVETITGVHLDSTGLFTGDETEVASADYLLNEDNRTFVFVPDPASANYIAQNRIQAVYQKSLRVTYVGGLASTPCVATWSKSGGTFTAGKFIFGETSGAIGKITETDSTSISYESLSGAFEEDETITEYTTFSALQTDGGLSAVTGETATLSMLQTECLAEAYPDLSMACEMYVEYLLKNRHETDASQVLTDGGVTRSGAGDLQKDFFATPIIRDMLSPYMNRLVQG